MLSALAPKDAVQQPTPAVVFQRLILRGVGVLPSS
jgi:hypothetical protein